MAEIKTLTDVINYTDKFDIKKIAFFETDEFKNVTVQTTQIDRYSKLVKQYIEEFKSDSEHKEKYKYRPDLLSASIYGTPSLAWLILSLNGFESSSRFIVKNKINLIPPKALENLFIELRSKDIKRIDKNHRENGVY